MERLYKEEERPLSTHTISYVKEKSREAPPLCIISLGSVEEGVRRRAGLVGVSSALYLYGYGTFGVRIRVLLFGEF